VTEFNVILALAQLQKAEEELILGVERVRTGRKKCLSRKRKNCQAKKISINSFFESGYQNGVFAAHFMLYYHTCTANAQLLVRDTGRRRESGCSRQGQCSTLRVQSCT
jgi:hypothetical protein